MKAPVTLLSLFLLLLLSGCGPSYTVPPGGVGREDYLAGLGRAGLLETEGARQWREQGRAALEAPRRVEPPFSGTFQADGRAAAAAEAYLLVPSERQQISVRVRLEGEGFIFLDLYRLRDGEEEAIFSTNQESGEFLARRDRTYILLVQPEIYAQGTVRVEIQPSER